MVECLVCNNVSYYDREKKYRYVLATQLNNLVILAKQLGVRYKLKGCCFESCCCHLNFRYRVCFEQGFPWHISNYRVQICYRNMSHGMNRQSFLISKIKIFSTFSYENWFLRNLIPCKVHVKNHIYVFQLLQVLCEHLHTCFG